MNNFDVGVIGVGVAGSLACLKLAKEHKNVKVVAFDIGRPPAKRRRQIEGFLGCWPNSDGKLYLNDLNKVSSITGVRKAKKAHTWLNKVLSNVDDFKIIKDKSPSVSVEKRFKKIGYDLLLNDYIQMYPKDIHILSKQMVEVLEQDKNIQFRFDCEIASVRKQKSMFIIITDTGQEYKCKKLVIASGRSGWRWASKLFAGLGIIDNNDTAKFGIRIETTTNNMKEFNKSNCCLIKDQQVELGPFSWFGEVIPEDHVDLAISAFRSNETRWRRDKVSFNLIGTRPFPQKGWEQTDRIGRLTFVLANDRIIRKKISTIMAGKSEISIIPEYNWLKDTLAELSQAIPDIISKAYYHVPTILPSVPQINLGDNLESEIDGLFIVGESAGVHGILSAALMGCIAVDSMCK